MSKFIYSTLANDNAYTYYTAGGADLPVVEKQVVIKGGSGMQDKRGETSAIGTLTEITDEEYDAIKGGEVFQRHVTNKFIVVLDKKAEPEAVASDMETRDKSGQMQEGDFKDTDAVKPSKRK